MNTATVYPASPRMPTADYSDVAELQRKLVEHSDALSAMANDLGMAKTVREFSSDQRKRCLAIAALPLLKAGTSAAAAELEARASEQYGMALKQLTKDSTQAEQTIADYDGRRLAWESVRSILSMQKESIRQL